MDLSQLVACMALIALAISFIRLSSKHSLLRPQVTTEWRCQHKLLCPMPNALPETKTPQIVNMGERAASKVSYANSYSSIINNMIPTDYSADAKNVRKSSGGCSSPTHRRACAVTSETRCSPRCPAQTDITAGSTCTSVVIKGCSGN